MDTEYYNWCHCVTESQNDAWEEGYRAYQNGESRDLNPYNNNDEWELNQAWCEGYSQAGQDD